MNHRKIPAFDGVILPDRLYVIDEICEILNIGRSTAHIKIRDGQLPVVYDGRIPKAPGRELIRYIAALPRSR